MAEELVPVVDRNDNIIEYKPRSVVHDTVNLLLHRGVHIVVFNSRGEFLLQKRSKSKKQFPGLWTSSSSGHISKGQTPEEAALRELEEEIGITKNKLEYVDKFILETKFDRELSWVYKTMSDGPFKIQEEEVSEIKFFDKNSIVEIIDQLTPFGKGVLNLLGLL